MGKRKHTKAEFDQALEKVQQRVDTLVVETMRAKDQVRGLSLEVRLRRAADGKPGDAFHTLLNDVKALLGLSSRVLARVLDGAPDRPHLPEESVERWCTDTAEPVEPLKRMVLLALADVLADVYDGAASDDDKKALDTAPRRA